MRNATSCYKVIVVPWFWTYFIYIYLYLFILSLVVCNIHDHTYSIILSGKLKILLCGRRMDGFAVNPAGPVTFRSLTGKDVE